MTETVPATPAVSPPVGFRLPTPGNWFDLDLDPRTRDESIASLVDAHVAQSPAAVHNREGLRRLLRRTAREAAQGGMIFASLMSEVAEGVPVSASATVTLRSAVSLGGAPISNSGDIAGHLRGQARAGWRGIEVRVAEIPTGSVVRLQGLQEGDVGGLATGVVTLVVQYFVPVPGTPSLAVLTFTTPTLALAEPFTALFDTMAENFSFEWSGDVAVHGLDGSVAKSGGTAKDEGA
jgi:hypothetical protein